MRYIAMGVIAVMFLWTGTHFFSHYTASGQGDGERAIAPPTQIEAPYRLAYVEGVPFLNFAGTLHALANGLANIGWLDSVDGMPFQEGQDDSRIMWEWLSANASNTYIEFATDGYYSMSSMTDEEKTAMLERFRSDDYDLIISMGTEAGTTLKNADVTTPFMAFSISNAVLSGIVESAEDSGYDNIWAHMDPERTKRLLSVFHDIFHFETMGIVYEDSPAGRALATVSDIYEAAAERNIRIVERHVNSPSADPLDQERYLNEIIAAHESLAAEVEAMFLTYGDWDIEKDVARIVAPFVNKKIPVFSMTGAEEVAQGALISVARADFSSWGEFGAEMIARALQGESMRNLPQILEDTPGIALNLTVAEQIGFQAPFEILLVADEIYH